MPIIGKLQHDTQDDHRGKHDHVDQDELMERIIALAESGFDI